MSDSHDPLPPLAMVEERLHVTKRVVETDRVQIRTVVDETPVVLSEIVERGAVEIVRVAAERAVSTAPEPRQDGDTLIISIVEERAVIEKRLFVVEELHIRRTVTHEPVRLATRTRKMRAVVEHPQSQGTDE